VVVIYYQLEDFTQNTARRIFSADDEFLCIEAGGEYVGRQVGRYGYWMANRDFRI
jgi:hypothetical protein